MMKIFCRTCALMMEREENLPPNFGRSVCEECGNPSLECYELEVDDED